MSASKQALSANLYCETVEGWFFGIKKTVEVVAKDNGGK
jgi:hypothetical protein